MAISLLYNPRGQRKTAIGTLVIEATLSETHEATCTVTDQPIETGARISDHIILDPERVIIEGFVSDSPINLSAGFNSQATFDELYALREARQLLTVVTGYKVYVDMAITRITVPRDQSTGQAIRFSVELKKINRVGSLTIQLFEDVLSQAQGAVDQASSRLNLGRFTPVDLTSNLPSLSAATAQQYQALDTAARDIASDVLRSGTNILTGAN
jgi:hypothetical protein